MTIVPRSNGAGGFTLFTPSEERLETGMMSKSYLEAQLTVALGGRVAEELLYGPDGITTGASNDLQQVRGPRTPGIDAAGPRGQYGATWNADRVEVLLGVSFRLLESVCVFSSASPRGCRVMPGLNGSVEGPTQTMQSNGIPLNPSRPRPPS